MNEPEIKKRNVLDKIIHNQVMVTCVTVMVVVFILIGASYAIIKDEDDEENISIKFGNMQAVLHMSENNYNLDDEYQIPLSDINGMEQEAYKFSLMNTGSIDIDYYEIRLIDQEDKNSTLPHKYLRYTIKSNNNEYIKPLGLSDNDNIIFSGSNLKVDESIDLEFKLWILENSPVSVLDKKFYGALEVILYQKNNLLDKYVIYNMNDENNSLVFKTSINEPITAYIPEKDGYTFQGWSDTVTGEVIYVKGDNYSKDKGMNLYAIWQAND